MVDGEYDFEVNTTDGTTVALEWNFEVGGVITQYFGGNFTSAIQNYTFHRLVNHLLVFNRTQLSFSRYLGQSVMLQLITMVKKVIAHQ